MTVVLIINCLILLFGSQGRPRSLKPPPLFFLEKEQGAQKGFCTWKGLVRSCSVSIPSFTGGGCEEERKDGRRISGICSALSKT